MPHTDLKRSVSRMPKPTKRRKRRKNHKGALIKGMSEFMPIDLIHESAFRDGLKKIMAGYAGVYVLYQGDRLYYVGLASDLFWRLHQHTRDRHRNKWDTFSIYRIRRLSYLKDLETLLLRVALPPGNRVTGHLHRDADLGVVLRDIAKDQERLVRYIRDTIG